MKLMIIAIIFCLPVFGKTFSLMHPEYNQTHDTGDLTLNGMIFASKTDWVLWLNHTRVSPNKTPEWLKIIAVTENNVKLEYQYNNLWYSVTLEPHDTFSPTIKKQQTINPSEN